MSYKSYFEDPDLNKYAFYTSGGAPSILESFKKEINEKITDIEEINISWYLFNNEEWYSYLKYIASYGIKVNIITIPREGYDQSWPKELIDLKSGKKVIGSYSKYSLASAIFQDFYSNDYDNLNIYFFNHCFIRSPYVKKFSRGNLPYSLHIKFCFVKKRLGYLLFLSSSNFAVRDLVKLESMVMVEDEPGYELAAKKFYADILKNSIPLKRFSSKLNIGLGTFRYEKPFLSPDIFFSAPFYFNSNKILEDRLVSLITLAKERIIVCAQHLSAFDYSLPSHFHSQNISKIETGLLGAVIDKAKEEIRVTLLSQTFVSENGEYQDKRFRTPQNKRNFQSLYQHVKGLDSVKYYVNDRIHSKFIIIDNLLLYCTFNFTPTQFIYLDQVNIQNFKNMPEERFSGIHSEVGAYVKINEANIVSDFIDHIEMIKGREDTHQVL